MTLAIIEILALILSCIAAILSIIAAIISIKNRSKLFKEKEGEKLSAKLLVEQYKYEPV